jgi:hypothetical protein
MAPVRKNFIKQCPRFSMPREQETTSFQNLQVLEPLKQERKISQIGVLRARPSSVGFLDVMWILRQAQVHQQLSIALNLIEITKILNFQFQKVLGFIYLVGTPKFKYRFLININQCCQDFRPQIPRVTLIMALQWVSERKVISPMVNSSNKFPEQSTKRTKSIRLPIRA